MTTAINRASTPVTISQAARLAGIGVETVRFYERSGLLPLPDRTGAGYRLYNESDVRRLSFIRRAKALGFSLKEIRELLDLTEHRGATAHEVKSMTVRKLDRIREQIRDLRAMEKALSQLEEQCTGAGLASHCPILNAMTLERIGQKSAAMPRRRADTRTSQTLRHTDV
jgi:Hg(II)-responsive transcriptional regulator